jgi:hypothetical protein
VAELLPEGAHAKAAGRFGEKHWAAAALKDAAASPVGRRCSTSKPACMPGTQAECMPPAQAGRCSKSVVDTPAGRAVMGTLLGQIGRGVLHRIPSTHDGSVVAVAQPRCAPQPPPVSAACRVAHDHMRGSRHSDQIGPERRLLERCSMQRAGAHVGTQRMRLRPSKGCRAGSNHSMLASVHAGHAWRRRWQRSARRAHACAGSRALHIEEVVEGCKEGCGSRAVLWGA